MNANSLQTFLSRKGQIVNVAWTSEIKSPKGSFATVTKRVELQARAGVNYDNMRDVIAKRESGELPAHNAGLTWGHWHTVAGVSLFPHVIAHTPKGATEEKHYLRFAKLDGATPKVEYFVDGNPVSKEVAKSLTLASEWKESAMPDVFTVTADKVEFIR